MHVQEVGVGRGGQDLARPRLSSGPDSDSNTVDWKGSLEQESGELGCLSLPIYLLAQPIQRWGLPWPGPKQIKRVKSNWCDRFRAPGSDFMEDKASTQRSGWGGMTSEALGLFCQGWLECGWHLPGTS